VRRHCFALFVVVSAAVSVACGRTVDPATWTTTVQPLASPAQDSSMEPQLTSSSRGTILSWVELNVDTATLKFAERTADGWSPARTVASGSDWFLTYADTPAVVRLSDGTLVTNLQKTTDADVEAYDLQLLTSKDDGKTWSAPFMPHHDGTKTQHGFASMVEMPDGGLGIAWLDGRDAASPNAEEGGEMAVRFATFDKAWKQTGDTVVNARVCECCPTTTVVTPDGVLTAFRDRTKDEVRDIHVSRLENGKWTDATAVHDDNWTIQACPVNGPALSARGRDVAVAWFTAQNDLGQTWAAFSNDSGRTWGAPVRLDDGNALGRVDVEMLEDGGAVATWIEFANKQSQVRLRRVDPSGGRSSSITVAAGGSVGNGYPRLARQGTELLIAWSDAGAVKTASAKLP
jgi:hypothetical protein